MTSLSVAIRPHRDCSNRLHCHLIFMLLMCLYVNAERQQCLTASNFTPVTNFLGLLLSPTPLAPGFAWIHIAIAYTNSMSMRDGNVLSNRLLYVDLQRSFKVQMCRAISGIFSSLASTFISIPFVSSAG